ncbi:sulfite exporter TauE/SafE family protein [Candidatus Pseudothioglobus singularis]|nr:sulfite exporter TauE/SafE family protein [Candidatus Pseudothioglobus singularis]MDC1065793.1 sulfite exporter TauE/SafE family protein [Candidatus Pseudothioglobus singularis]MDC3280684.1 sulfite exporter TauE/SafE family protein [Candidatus Pseudothioglobus singularis]
MLISDPVIFQSLLLFGAFFAGLVQGATGFGSGIVLNAFWLHILEPSAAISLNIVSCLFVSALPIYKLRKTLDFSKLKSFVFFGVIGIPTGLLILTMTDPSIFKTTVGFILVIFSIWKFKSKGILINFKSNPALDKLIGFISGILGGFAALGGILPTIWVNLQRLPKDTQRGTYEPFIFITSIAAVISFYFAGFLTLDIFYNFLKAFPALMLGSWIGIKIYALINEALFRQVILGLIFLAGLVLLF